jgi:hypothetical protein
MKTITKANRPQMRTRRVDGDVMIEPTNAGGPAPMILLPARGGARILAHFGECDVLESVADVRRVGLILLAAADLAEQTLTRK